MIIKIKNNITRQARVQRLSMGLDGAEYYEYNVLSQRNLVEIMLHDSAHSKCPIHLIDKCSSTTDSSV